MKAMRYIWIVMSLVSVLSVSAQTLAQQPSNDFQSTSTMTGSGSAYSATPSLNADGTATYNGASYSPAKAPGGPRKAGGITEPKDDDEEFPVGDAVWPMMLMALAFGGVIYLRKRRALNR